VYSECVFGHYDTTPTDTTPRPRPIPFLTLSSYTPLLSFLHSLSYTLFLHSVSYPLSHALFRIHSFSYTHKHLSHTPLTLPLIHSYTFPHIIFLVHSSHTLLSYTPLVHSSHALLSYTLSHTHSLIHTLSYTLSHTHSLIPTPLIHTLSYPLSLAPSIPPCSATLPRWQRVMGAARDLPSSLRRYKVRRYK
jgi:hypothetical protein